MRDEFDEVLDRALASYADPPRRIGLEGRVLAGVERRAARARTGSLAMVLCAAVLVCCALWLQMPKPAAPAIHRVAVAARRSSETGGLREQVGNLALARAPLKGDAKPALRRPRDPKLPVFPTPVPLDSQELALVRLASGDPQNIPRELLEPGKPIEPIQIAAVEIKPLD